MKVLDFGLSKLVEQKNASMLGPEQTKHRVGRGGVQNDLPLEEFFTIKLRETDFDLLALD